MKCGDSFEEFEMLNGISVEEFMSVFEAILETYPMIVLANLSKNTYMMVKDDGFLADEMPKNGIYDEMIDSGVKNIHPSYQNLFLERFSRESLLRAFSQGKKEAFAKLYQKGRGSQYQWVSTHVIRVQDKNGDVCEVCMNRILSPESSIENQRISGGPM
ncbi:MAG: hypothetical protein NC180_10135 [Muribaculaceae bacterium]|nr:hypothetical protein [Roseburia sp.]MCM1431912.1 hypothetical protein [Muribaculaceae bacterium]MCM1493568.1 hypothetical protein [Muribaculaceae bacterium]